MGKLKTLWWIIVALLAIWFGFWVVVDNPESITVKLAGFEMKSLPSGLLLLAVFSGGCLVGLLAGLPSVTKLKRQVGRLNRQLPKS